MNNRAIIFIDGSNFYFKLKNLLTRANNSGDKRGLIDFDFIAMSKWIACKNNSNLVEARYYIGAINRQQGNEKSEKMYANQQKLLAKL